MAYSLATAMGVTAEFVPVDRDDLARALDTGVCDIVMSGLVITVRSAERIDFSNPYHDEAMGFLVPDYRRAEFRQLAMLQGRPLSLAAPSERLAVPIRRALPSATVASHPLAPILDGGGLDGFDAFVLPMDQAYYVSRVQPALAAVAPADSHVRAVLAYGLPTGAFSFRDVVNSWIDVSRAAGLFTSAYDYWVRGKAQTPHDPRWSIGHDVLGLW
jgi:ABC-type amino acid transport substrate-binding protein